MPRPNRNFPHSCTRFNEAGAGRPRMRDHRELLIDIEHGFNEAGAGRPRMRRSSREAFCASRGFNEAGAGRPRMLVINPNRNSLPDCASMRPGPEGPGCIPARLGWSRGAMASMRPGPEGPGCINHEYTARRTGAASMRPGPEGPGCIIGHRCFRRVRLSFNEAGAGRPPDAFNPNLITLSRIPASMRPGPEGPGCGADPSRLEMKSIASMRPGPEGPGCRCVSAADVAAAQALQ